MQVRALERYIPLTLLSIIYTISENLKASKSLFFSILGLMSNLNFILRGSSKSAHVSTL